MNIDDLEDKLAKVFIYTNFLTYITLLLLIIAYPFYRFYKYEIKHWYYVLFKDFEDVEKDRLEFLLKLSNHWINQNKNWYMTYKWTKAKSKILKYIDDESN